MDIELGFPVTRCDRRAVALGRRVVEELYGPQTWIALPAPVMGAEDFSYVLEKIPGAMFFVGASAAGSDWRSCCGLHSNRMVIDESVMARGAAVLAVLAARFVGGGEDLLDTHSRRRGHAIAVLVSMTGADIFRDRFDDLAGLAARHACSRSANANSVISRSNGNRPWRQ